MPEELRTTHRPRSTGSPAASSDAGGDSGPSQLAAQRAAARAAAASVDHLTAIDDALGELSHADMKNTGCE